MAATLADIERAAILSALSFSEEESCRLLGEFRHILTWLDQLLEVDTEGVEPLTYVHERGIPCRADDTRSCLPREDALMNAPHHTRAFFVVPRVHRS